VRAEGNEWFREVGIDHGRRPPRHHHEAGAAGVQRHLHTGPVPHDHVGVVIEVELAEVQQRRVEYGGNARGLSAEAGKVRHVRMRQAQEVGIASRAAGERVDRRADAIGAVAVSRDRAGSLQRVEESARRGERHVDGIGHLAERRRLVADDTEDAKGSFDGGDGHGRRA